MTTDMDREFRALDLLDGPDLTKEIDRRAMAPMPAIAPPPRRRRMTAGVVAIAVFVAAAVFAWAVLRPIGEGRVHGSPSPPTTSTWDRLSVGWTRLADLPSPLEASVRIWTGSSLIVWGGNEGDGVGQSAVGWRLDGADADWRQIAPSPLSPRSWSAAAWTGSEVLIWGGADGSGPMDGPLGDGAAYDPATDTWRPLTVAPIAGRTPLVSVWTGSQWLLWGEGPSRTHASAMDGVAYDPAADTWSAIANAPLPINDGHAVWTGAEMIVFGAELIGGNHAQTDTAIGEAYDPSTGTWRKLPPTHLDPQATDVAWDGNEMVAADYVPKVQTYDPIADAWGDLPDPPIHAGEDLPQLAVAGGRIVEHFFGRTVELTVDRSGWDDITGSGDHGYPELLSAERFVAGFSWPSGVDAGHVWAYLSAPDQTAQLGDWTELPLTDAIRRGSVEIWAGDRLLAHGGPSGGDKPSTRWWAYTPATRTWDRIADAPFARDQFRSVWTGTEAVFWGGYDGAHGHRDGMAYDPATDSWRTIPQAPLDTDSPSVAQWTGSELILWGGGHPGDPANHSGAAYDPATDTWRRIADSPVPLNAATGVWSGTELYVFGSLLDNGNHAQVFEVVGAAYDPATDSWRRLPNAPLSQQASTGAWVDGRFIAYDYVGKVATYDPQKDAWRALPDLPFDASECYPDALAVDHVMLAWYCGDLAVFDPEAEAWAVIRGGITEMQIAPPAYGGALYQLWRFASLIAADGTVYFDAEGLSVEARGEACYGCSGSPRSLWVYRPPAFVAPSVSPAPTADDATSLVVAFLDARYFGQDAVLRSLVSSSGSAAFASRSAVGGFGQAFHRWRTKLVDQRGARFLVRVELEKGKYAGVLARETAVVAVGRALDGSSGHLVIVGWRQGWPN